MYSKVKSIHLILFTKESLITTFLIMLTSVYFSFFSWFFLIIFLISVIFFLSKNIFKENSNLFYLIIISFFLKFFLSEFFYIYNESNGYELGTLSGSDDLSYFLKGKFIAEFLRNDLSYEFSRRSFLTQLYDNEFFYYFNAIINLIDTNISLKEIIKIAIFTSTISVIIVYNLCRDIKLNNSSILIIIILFIVDLKINFYSNFNLKETYLLFSSVSSIYLCSTIITNNYKNKKIITLSILGLIFSMFIRFQFFLINILILIFTFLLKFYLIKKKSIIFKPKIILLLFTILLFTMNYFFQPLDYLKNLNEYYSSIYLNDQELNNQELNNSISNRLYLLKYSDNFLNILVHFVSGIIGIFPIFKEINSYLKLHLFAQIWTQILMIVSCFFMLNFFKNIKKVKNDTKFLTGIIFLKVLINLFIATVVSVGSLVFFRYTTFLNVFLIFIIGSSIKFNNSLKIVKNSILVYLLINLILLLPYYLLKNNVI